MNLIFLVQEYTFIIPSLYRQSHSDVLLLTERMVFVVDYNPRSRCVVIRFERVRG
jgi:hypothetical protein